MYASIVQGMLLLVVCLVRGLLVHLVTMAEFLCME